MLSHPSPLVHEPTTASALLASNDTRCRLTMLHSCSELGTNDDLFLGLGITEIAGGAGCGKTQIALSLCVTCACTSLKEADSSMQGRFAKAIFVSLVEGVSRHQVSKRLSQIATARISEMTEKLPDQSATTILERILLKFIRNQDEFDSFLFHELPRVMNQDKHVAFVAFDSIASLFRDFGESTAIERSGQIFATAAQIKRLSGYHLVPFLVVNQVSADVKSSDAASVPALGVAWAHCVNESFFLTRIEANHNFVSADDQKSLSSLSTTSKFERRLRIRFSPSRSPRELRFIIATTGAVMLGPSYH